MRFFYSSGAMGYNGEGYFWHKLFNFPDLPLVTKTITSKSKVGLPFAVLPFGNSVFNKVSLHNKGFSEWLISNILTYDMSKITLSVAGTDAEINDMVSWIDSDHCPANIKAVKAIELNFSCPNVTDHGNVWIPETNKDLYLKLNHTQNPYEYNLDNIKGIRVNSIPLTFCGGSGKVAQKKNWEFIERYNKEGLNVAGCSFTSFEDIKRLGDMGCKEVGIGSIIITNPRLVEKINDYNDWALYEGLRSR